MNLKTYYILVVIYSFSIIHSANAINEPSTGGSSISAGQGINTSAYAQSRMDIIPHSPEVESLGRYGVQPVELYTGMPEINIPLFEIKTPSISAPFSLQYSNNGCKPNEIATSVGLGWSLSGGGIITRVIKGKFDDLLNTNQRYDYYTNINPLTANYNFIANVGNGLFDTEPDIFIFNIGKYSGKFIILNGLAYDCSCPNVRIIATLLGNSVIGFKIIDDEGNNYLFNFNTETTYGKGVSAYTSAWYLDQIVSANKQDIITFSYKKYSIIHPGTVIDIYKYSSQSNSGGTNPVSKEDLGVEENTGIQIDGLLLESVSSNYNSAYFSSNTDRVDVQSSYLGTTVANKAKMLDKITYSTYDNSTSYDIILNHTYFTNNSRLKLNSITFSPINKQYSFDYYDFNFPSTNSFSIDLYGYFNGKSNQNLFPQGYFLTNTIYLSANRDADMKYSIDGIIKNINYPTGGKSTFLWEQNKIGTAVPTILHPEFKLTSVYSNSNIVNNATTISSGFSLESDQTIAIKYNYTTNTFLQDDFVPTVPMLRIYNASTHEIVYTSPLNFSTPASGYPFNLVKGSYILEVNCESAFYSVTGSIVYQKIDDGTSVLANGPGLRIKEISSYDINSITPATVDDYYYNTGNVNLMKDAINTSSLITAGGSCSGPIPISTSTAFYAASRTPLSDFVNEPFYYSNVTKTTQNQQLSGKTEYVFKSSLSDLDVKMTSQTDYKYDNGSFIPLKSKTFKYDYITKNIWNCFGVIKSYTIGTPPNTIGANMFYSTDYTDLNCWNDTYEMDPHNVYVIVREYPLLKNETETLFDGSLNGIVTTTDYFYDNPEHTYPTRIKKLNSNGDTLITQIKYPLDYNWDNIYTPDAINDKYKLDILNQTKDFNNSRSAIYSNLINTNINTSFCCTPSNMQAQYESIVNAIPYMQNFLSSSNSIISAKKIAMNNYISSVNNSIANNSSQSKKGILWMRRENVISPIIEKYESIKKKIDNKEYLVSAIRNNYSILNDKGVVKTSVDAADFSCDLLKATFISNPENYYKTKFNFTYSNKFQLTSQTGPDLIPTSYLWGYKDMYPIAEILNSTYDVVSSALVGSTPDQLSIATLPDMSIVNNLRNSSKLSNSLVTTYTYKPLVGIQTRTAPNGIVTTYVYDIFNRLWYVKDNKGNKITNNQYNYSIH